jgi:hypothetical protein
MANSCGTGIPLFEFLGERDALRRWAAGKGIEGLRRYEEEHNATSLDGLPGLRTAEERLAGNG